MEPGGERSRAAVRRVAHVGAAERCVRDATDCEHSAPHSKLACEDASLRDFAGRRWAIRGLGARMGRDDVPEQDIVFHAELSQHAMDDRGGGLGRAGARQQSLRRERDAGDASAAVARRLADEEDARAAV